MPKAYISPELQRFMDSVGRDIRRMREKADVTQTELGDPFGWNKDAISKIERGINTLSLHDYFRIVLYFRTSEPDHPALPLARRYGMVR